MIELGLTKDLKLDIRTIFLFEFYLDIVRMYVNRKKLMNIFEPGLQTQLSNSTDSD